MKCTVLVACFSEFRRKVVQIVLIMPGLIGIGEFIDETREDYSSPTTSTFVSRMPQCRQTISALEEVNIISVTLPGCFFKAK